MRVFLAALSGALPVALVAAAAGRGGVVQQQNLRVGEEQAQGMPSAENSFIIRQPTVPEWQTLRVCNAYAYRQGLDVSLVRTKQELGNLEYKNCAEYRLVVEDGDQIDFKINGAFIGTFAVASLPKGTRTLLLIVSRRPGSSLGAFFTSHAFSAPESPDVAQVAVIDTYQGKAGGKKALSIQELGTVNAVAEEIPLNSIVQVTPGNYKISMPSSGSEAFKAVKGQCYVLVHVGRDSTGELEGQPANSKSGSLIGTQSSYPQGFIVFPQQGHGSSAPRGALVASFHLLLILAAHLVVGSLEL